jgi:hypothetical protein
MKQSIVFGLSLTVLAFSAAQADTTLTWGRGSLRLSDGAVPLSLVLSNDGVECLNRAYKEPFAEAQSSDGTWHPACALQHEGGNLVVGFRDIDTSLTLAVDGRPDWLALRVVATSGKRPQAVRFAMFNPAFTEIVGKRLNIGWNPVHAFAVLAASRATETEVMGQTQVTLPETIAAVSRGEAGVNPRVRLTAGASAANGKLNDAIAAIVVSPTAEFDRIAEAVARAYNLGATGFSPRTDVAAQGSTLILEAAPRDADHVIRTCRDFGVRQVSLPASTWGANAHPVDVQAFVAHLQSAGISTALRSAVPATEEKQKALAGLANAGGFYAFDAVPASATTADTEEQFFRLIQAPRVRIGALANQRLWHALTYVPAPQAAAGQTPKEATDASVAALQDLRTDRMPSAVSFGAFSANLQFDDLEYLLCRSIAFDAPVTVAVRADDVQRNPLAPQLLRLFRIYENARLTHLFSEAEKAPMRQPGQSFTLILRKTFPPVLVPCHTIYCGQNRSARAAVGPFEGGSVAVFWDASGRSDVRLDLSPFIARIADFDDQRVVAKKSADDKLVLPISASRLSLFCPTLDPATLEQKIKNSLSTQTP